MPKGTRLEVVPAGSTEVVKHPVDRRKVPGARIEIGTVVGLVVAVAGVLFACQLEGQSLRLLLQPTAMTVVVAGTFAAVLIQYPPPVLREALVRAAAVLHSRSPSSAVLADDLAGYARLADRGGLLVLDKELEGIRDPFLKKALMLAVDGATATEIRATMELDMAGQDHTAQMVDDVFETAGSTAPPLGILGAVLGLIHVMRALANLNDVGAGIAAAFVSTLYGVGLANLLILPLGGKLRLREMEQRRQNEMMLEGVLGIVARMRPRFLESRLRSYFRSSGGRSRPKAMAV